MRIISGSHKGRRLTAPKNLPVRPTKDMAKEALFNILNNGYYFPDCEILDLFSGTGNIAYEFASRGAKAIYAVDLHPGCVSFIQKTTETLEMPIKAIHSDVFEYLNKANHSWDIIFADPFYDMDATQFEQLVALVFEKALLKEDGSLILEHSKHSQLSTLPHWWRPENTVEAPLASLDSYSAKKISTSAKPTGFISCSCQKIIR